MGSETEHDRRVERLVTFADAVVAIAITLLAIPLIELASEASEGFDRWWAATAFPLLGFAISFAVIARFWWGHHRIYEHVERWDTALVWVTMAWLFSIVLLSAATAVTTRVDVSRASGAWAFPLYVSVMILSSLLLTTQAVIVHRRPSLTDARDDMSLRRVAGSVEATIGFVIALVVGTALPHVNYYAFFVLALTGRFDALILRALRRIGSGRRTDA